MKPAFILLFVTLIAVPVHGAGQQVKIRLAWVDPPPERAAVTLHARKANDSTEPLEVLVDGAEASIPLSAGQWFVRASCPGYWSEPAIVFVGEQPAEATLTLYRATRLRAEVTIPPPGNARAVDVYFNPAETTSGRPRGSTTCPLSDGHLECELPSGVYDLAFRIPGHASIYRWDADLRTKPSVQSRRLAFRVGSTLSGRVEVSGSSRVDSLEGVEVTLRNAIGGDRNDALRNRESVARAVTRPNARGFFAFDVLPGSYVVSAASNGLASEERQVTVIEGREAVLEESLTLERLLSLTVNVQLPYEGATQPWKLEVVRFDSEGEPSAERVVSVPADGVCRFDGQLSGFYAVKLRLRDSVWASLSPFLEQDTTLDMAVRITKLRGSVRLGDEPLAATLLFRSREKGFRIPVRTGADGTFFVFLPELADKPWEQVEIQSDQPTVKRVLNDVPMDRGDDGVATMHVRIPATAIDGVVVDENERPVKDGLINMTAPDDFRQFKMSDGMFTIHGLEPGRYSLTAATRERETEAPLVVDIPGEGEGRHDVVLRVAPISQLRGSVVSASGPVIGASVYIAPANDTHEIVGSIPVDTKGSFDFRVPPRTRDIVVGVTAPGFSFRLMRMPLPAEGLDLVVDQNGGVLTVDGRLGAGAQPFRPYLIHDGAILPAFAAAYLAQARLSANPIERVQFEIASAAEGTYALCLLSSDEARSVRLGARPPESRCSFGVLTRHGALTLRAPDVDENAVPR